MDTQQAMTGSAFQSAFKKEKDSFIEACAFAKVVETASGAAILIEGDVYQISGPRNVARWIAEALRSGK